MKFTVTRVITLAVAITGGLVLAASLLVPVHARVTVADQFDAAGLYKTKCVACHGAAADKRFDKAKADETLLEAIMKGKKAEKPPNMPAFEEKGVTADQAKALLDYMKSIKQ
ncbi:MAG TPA: cytochrome c [Pyrinomonadaceae bacterium]|nr:cytochrome c [Pyrinomonadaceae bacterium]